MEEIYTNIYKESRKKAGLEQSEAADLIGVSYHSLAKYEKKINAVIPPDDVVRNGLPVYTTESDTTYYFSYTVEEAPVVGYSTQITYDESGATATATIRNTPVDFEVQFKYYNQRFCEKTGDPYQDDAGFIENYGLLGYTNVMPADYAAESFGDYEFAYWAYNQEGTQIASVERNFGYRVTTDTKLYAVYAQAGASNPGISISANTNDTYVDSTGVSKTRLNIFASVFGVPQFDTSVQKLSFVNISLSTQIRDNPKVYTPDKINALFEQYKGQLIDIIDKFDKKQGSKQFSSAETFAGALDPLTGDLDKTLNLTLTTKGYTYTVTSNGNTPGENDATIKLSNKNRAQFTVTYKTSALNLNNTGSNGNTCLVYCGALKYNGTWNISTNCLIYYNGNVVDNTSSVWG